MFPLNYFNISLPVIPVFRLLSQVSMILWDYSGLRENYMLRYPYDG